jgi:hypothetical protein
MAIWKRELKTRRVLEYGLTVAAHRTRLRALHRAVTAWRCCWSETKVLDETDAVMEEHDQAERDLRRQLSSMQRKLSDRDRELAHERESRQTAETRLEAKLRESPRIRDPGLPPCVISFDYLTPNAPAEAEWPSALVGPRYAMRACPSRGCTSQASTQIRALPPLLILICSTRSTSDSNPDCATATAHSLLSRHCTRACWSVLAV